VLSIYRCTFCARLQNSFLMLTGRHPLNSKNCISRVKTKIYVLRYRHSACCEYKFVPVQLTHCGLYISRLIAHHYEYINQIKPTTIQLNGQCNPVPELVFINDLAQKKTGSELIFLRIDFKISFFLFLQMLFTKNVSVWQVSSKRSVFLEKN
jgi:hypothetical protein